MVYTNYECLLKGMLYCPRNGQELLSALGVTLVCDGSYVFVLVLQVPLSIIDAFSKCSNGVVVGRTRRDLFPVRVLKALPFI